MTVRPLRAHDAGRRPILEHDVCWDGENEMEQALAAVAAWPYADEPPPTVAEGHRQRLREPPCGSLFASVTRLIANGSPEAKSAGCMAALKKEKDKMVARKVWGESAVDEWAKVRVNDKDASVGRVFSIMGETHAERRVPEADKEYKARVVFAGNNIQTASRVAPHELFQEVSSAPAAMASVRATLAVGALRGWRPMVRDAAQAYIQASIVGPGRPATWVRLLRSMKPPVWLTKDGKPAYADPNVPLLKALYGHPESGALWEKHLASILITLGWKKCDSHPGIWIHTSGAVLAVYVDDFLTVAPRDKEGKLWADIAVQVSLDEEQALIGKFFGAHHVFKKNGNITTLNVELDRFMKDAAAIYAAEIGATKLAEARKPYLPENIWDFAPKGGEQAGEQSATYVLFALDEAALNRASQPPRHHRGDTRLASKVSSWNTSHDRAFKRLMQYVATKPDLRLHSTLSTEGLADTQLVMSPDADLAGDFETAKSTTGMFLEFRSRDGAR